MTTEPSAIGRDPYAALRVPDFLRLLSGEFIASLGEQMAVVALGWELYERTSSPLALGLVGLVQVLPVILLALPAGHWADHHNRKRIVVVAEMVLALCALSLALWSYTAGPIWLVYMILMLIGIARAFNGPARGTLVTQAVPAALFTNAATWSSSVWQLATIIGPGLGGLLFALSGSASLIYALNAGSAALCALLIGMMKSRQAPRTGEPTPTMDSLKEGLSFVRNTRVFLAAITLDLFAVLLGGATALLPVFARDILLVGPTGLGWLRTAPSIGAILTSLLLVYLPPFRRAGWALLWSVAGFGLATVVFGLSQSFWLSLLMLGLLGAFDQVSVVVRTSLFLLRTPDAMRGRVGAINSIFIGASNELGAFESGAVAALFTPVIAVVSGGIGTMLVVLATALIWPEIRRLGRLDE
ncbi:MAG TPA: MFS transporter [Herpetosiphonaceae bacterium]